jgi:hypothetical protein
MSFFREVLKAGRSLIVLRTDSHEIDNTACSILDHTWDSACKAEFKRRCRRQPVFGLSSAWMATLREPEERTEKGAPRLRQKNIAPSASQ